MDRDDERSERAPEHGGPAGEDHREGPPGYDLDEQEAIEELEREEQSGSGERPDDS